MAFETNKEPKLDVMQPDLDQIEDLGEEDPSLEGQLHAILARLDKLELFLVDFGWGE